MAKKIVGPQLATVSQATIDAAIFDEISSMRNFYAHRNGDTMERARRTALNWGIVGLSHVDEITTRTKPHRPVSIFDDWLVEVEQSVRELVR